MDVKGAKILRERFENEHGAVPDAEPTKKVEHGLPIYRWLGITPAEPAEPRAVDAS